MFLAKAENIINNRSFGARFESEQDANDWVNRQIEKSSFGKPARQAIRGEDAFDEFLVISEFEDTDEEGKTRTIVSLRAEYDYSVEEIDPNGDSDESKNQRRENADSKIAIFKKFKTFGENVELYFTALINERGYTQEQKDSLQSNSDVIAVLAELKFGRIGKAKGMVDAIVADEDLFFEADLAIISQYMADFLSELS